LLRNVQRFLNHPNLLFDLPTFPVFPLQRLLIAATGLLGHAKAFRSLGTLLRASLPMLRPVATLFRVIATGTRALAASFRTLASSCAYSHPPYLCAVKIPFKNVLPIALAAAALAACSSPTISENDGPSEASAAEMALMSRHDSLMDQTAKLYEFKSKLSGYHTEAAAPYIHGLLAADGAMRAWMYQYKAPDTTAAPATRLAYYQQQQQKLDAVHRQYQTTLDSATRFTTEHPAAGDVPPPTK
jgi:hypothetical protein